MNYINILGSKLKQYNLFLPTILVGLFLLYIPSIGSIPFGDDFFYIFNNFHIKDQPNPFVYWNINSDSYKSWPMTYSLIWVLFKVFGSKFYLYRLFNIFIHFLNAFIFCKLLEEQKIGYKRSFTLLFLLHPLCFESIFWIFQVKTLCATLFLLISYLYVLKHEKSLSNKDYIVSIVSFFISITFKNVAIFIPFLYLFLFIKSKRKKYLLTPIFIVSFISGIESIKGITVSEINTIKAQSYEDSYFKNISTFSNKIKESNDLKRKELKRNQLKNKNQNWNILINNIPEKKSFSLTIKKYKSYLTRYFNNNFNLNSNIKKASIAINSFSFYLIASTGIHSNYFVYPDLKLNSFKSILYICLFFIILIFFIFYYEKIFDENLLAVILLFIPISGLFYVPYMEFSYVADHWFYPSLIFLIIYFSKKVSNFNSQRSQSVLNLIIVFFAIKTFFLSFSLISTKSHLYNNLSISPNSTILYEYIIELEKRDLNYKKALALSERLFPLSDNKISLLKNMLFFSTELNSPQLQLRYLILQVKTYLKVNNISEARRTLNSIPLEYKTPEILYLRSLIKSIDGRFTNEDLKRINSILIN